MPRRNLTVLSLAVIISLTCYFRADRNRYAASLASAMNVVTGTYVEDVNYRDLYENSMRGMIGSLDPYSDYIGPDTYGQFMEGLDQEFGGVGIMVEISRETNRLTVMTPLVDTPAYRAGIKAGDTILAIDDKDTLGMPLKDAVLLMRGRPGEPVSLRLRHVGEDEPTEVVIKRAIIPLESVLGDHRRDDGSWIYELETDPRITYIRLITFGERTFDELVETLEASRSEALILDLRDNAGGLLSSAVKICDLFVDEGDIVTTRGRDGETFRAFSASSSISLGREIPIVVLVNTYSASAAEIVAACLQDTGRAVVIGNRTWGKGTVQNVIEIEGGKAAIKLTTATYWRPSGKNIHRSSKATDEEDWGVQPDEGFEVKLTDDEADRVRRTRRYRDGFTIESSEDTEIEIAPEDENETESDDAEEVVIEAESETFDPSEFYDPALEKAVEYLREKLPEAT